MLSDKFHHVQRYMFGEARNGISCYADQVALSSCHGCGGSCTITIAQDYFKNKSISNPGSKLAQAVEIVENHCRHQGATGFSGSPNETDQGTSERSSTQLATAGSLGTEKLTNTTRHGLQIVDLDQEAAFINAVQDHAIVCKHKLLASQEPKKIGFDRVQRWDCPFCTTVVVQRAGRTVKANHGSHGHDTSELNGARIVQRKRSRPSSCSRCKAIGHMKTNCTEPEYNEATVVTMVQTTGAHHRKKQKTTRHPDVTVGELLQYIQASF
jgi:hypothetical protein